MSVDATTPRRLGEASAWQGHRDTAARWLRPLAPAVLVVVAAAALGTDPRPAVSGRGLPVTAALSLFVLSGVVSVCSFSRLRLHLAAIVALLVASVALIWLQPGGVGIAGVFVGMSLVAPVTRGSRMWPIVALGGAGLAAVFALGHGISPVAAVLNAIMLVAFFGMLVLAIRLADANRRSEALVCELERSRAAAARSAGIAERQRLAREMHDVLAHSLSGLLLQLEGARMLAAEDPTDPRLPVAVERAHSLGRTGLEEALRAIGTLRDDELPGPERLAALARQFEHDHRVSCRFSVSGTARPLRSEARLAVFRVAQEALTNIARHADPERVEIRLDYDPLGTRLTVEDVGTAGTSPDGGLTAAGGGYGLTGMRERAELIGGTLTAGSTGHGFRVVLQVPEPEPAR